MTDQDSVYLTALLARQQAGPDLDPPAYQELTRLLGQLAQERLEQLQQLREERDEAVAQHNRIVREFGLDEDEQFRHEPDFYRGSRISTGRFRYSGED